MVRLLLGLIKGGVVGGALGYGAFALGLGGGLRWIVYGLVGAVVGLLCGRPLWSHLRDRSSTMWTAILKAAFGFGVGCGLFALARLWAAPELTLLDQTRPLVDFQFIVGGVIGAIYGAFVEVDDAPARAAASAATPAKKPR